MCGVIFTIIFIIIIIPIGFMILDLDLEKTKFYHWLTDVLYVRDKE